MAPTTAATPMTTITASLLVMNRPSRCIGAVNRLSRCIGVGSTPSAKRIEYARIGPSTSVDSTRPVTPSVSGSGTIQYSLLPPRPSVRVMRCRSPVTTLSPPMDAICSSLIVLSVRAPCSDQ